MTTIIGKDVRREMNIINEQNVALHKEAIQALEQADKAGWKEAVILLNKWNPVYPAIHLYVEDEVIAIHTVPEYEGEYAEQLIAGVGIIKYCHPVLSPDQVMAIRSILQ
jgi:hypothetical protein